MIFIYYTEVKSIPAIARASFTTSLFWRTTLEGHLGHYLVGRNAPTQLGLS
jgi:hypothetical protein